MKKFTIVLSAALLAGVGAGPVNAADQSPDARGGVRIGFLDCTFGGGVGYLLGSAKEIDCDFRSSLSGDRSERYGGVIRKFGVDLGFTKRSRVPWAVFAPTAGYHQSSLAGVYSGATAEATVGAGIGTNVLFGGTAGSIHLQPVSVTLQPLAHL